MGLFTKPLSPEQIAKRREKAAERSVARVAYLAKSRASIRALAEREYLRSRINLGVIKLDERQTLYLAMIFQELATMNDRAAAQAGEAPPDDVEPDSNLEAENDNLAASA
ncbi:MAG: hypothetical protein ACRENL_11360 [Candidatus Dormibacteria bacterium]